MFFGSNAIYSRSQLALELVEKNSETFTIWKTKKVCSKKKSGLLRTPVLFPRVNSHFGKTKQKKIMKKTMIMEFMLWRLN
jgi:hypothetical protein